MFFRLVSTPLLDSDRVTWPESSFLVISGPKFEFSKNSRVKFSNGLHITCGDSRTCFRCLTGVLVNFDDMQKITIFHDFRVSVTSHVSSCDLLTL